MIKEKLLGFSDTHWIGYEAFFQIILQHKSLYSPVIKQLRKNYFSQLKKLSKERIEALRKILKIETKNS